MAFRSIGPAVVVVGNPTTSLGAGMKPFDTEEATINPGISTAYSGDARTSGVPDVDALYSHAPKPEFRFSLQDSSIDTLKAWLHDFAVSPAIAPATTPTLGFGDELVKVAATAVPAVGIIPLSQIADGINAADAWWMPAGRTNTLDGIQHTEVGEGDIRVPYNVSVMGMKRKQDQAGVAIPAKRRIIWKGPPVNLSLAWSLPTTL